MSHFVTKSVFQDENGPTATKALQLNSILTGTVRKSQDGYETIFRDPDNGREGPRQ